MSATDPRRTAVFIKDYLSKCAAGAVFLTFLSGGLEAQERNITSSGTGPGIILLRSVSENTDTRQPWRTDSVSAENLPGLRIDKENILVRIPEFSAGTTVFLQESSVPLDLTDNPSAADPVTGLLLVKVSDKNGGAPASFTEFMKTDTVLKSRERLKVVSPGGPAQTSYTETTVYFEQYGVIGGDFSPPVPVMILSGKGVNLKPGSPVFLENKAAGILISHSEEKGISYALPYQIINQFISRYKSSLGIKLTIENETDPLRTFLPEPGFRTVPVINETVKLEAGLKPGRGGAFLSGLIRNSEAYPVLQKGDTIASAEGHNLSGSGLIEHPVYGSIPPEAYIMLNSRGEFRPSGSVADLTVVRGKEIKKVRMKLGNYRIADYRIPKQISGTPYLISGGLVFQELSLKYIEDAEKAGEVIPARLKYLLAFSRFSEGSLPERYVILDRILPLPINRGYEGKHLLLHGINGTAVRSLSHAAELIDESVKNKRNTEFLLESGRVLILDHAQTEDSDKETILRHGIQYLRK